MRALKAWLWIAPLLLLIALVVHAPARLVQWFIPDQMVFQAGSFQGTLWNGSAGQVVMGADSAYIEVDTVNWQLSPLSLLLLSPAADVELKTNDHSLAAAVKWLGNQRWQAKDLDLDMPAAVAAHFMAGNLLRNQQISGQLSLELVQLEVEGDRVTAVEGNISWQGARWHNGSNWLDFGSLAGELSQPASDIQLKLSDLSGPLEIDGQVLIKPDGKLDIKGTVGVRPQAPPEISQSLPLFAERQSDGKYKVDFQY